MTMQQMALITYVARGQGWPDLDEDEFVVVFACVVAIAGICWWMGYKFWEIVQGERYLARRRREKQQAAEAAERADREWMTQLQAEGWPVGVESLPVEQILEIVKQNTAVHYKVATAVMRR